MEEEIDKRYNDILRNLYINWILKFKNRNEELIRMGLSTSGAGIKSLYEIIQKLAYDTCEELDTMFQNVRNEFDSKVSLKILQQYINKSEKSMCSHIDCMAKDIIDRYGENMLTESNKLMINNIKGNVKSKLQRIYEKNKNINEFKRINVSVIISTIITVLGFIIGIISLFLTIKGNK